MKFNKTFWLPHAIAAGTFILLTALYFYPVLTGKTLEQHDISMWEGMSKEIQDFRETTGKEPLWTNSMFGGMPAYQISVLYPNNLVKHVNSIITLGLPFPINMVLLALLGFYILLVSLKVDFRLGIAGAIAYAFCSYNFVVIQAGHNSKMHAIALMPLVVLGVLLTFRGKYILGGAITAMSLALQIYANHLQITYYLAMCLGLLVIAEIVSGIVQKNILHLIKAGSVLIVASVLAVLPNLGGLLTTEEYGKYTTRGPSELTEKRISSGLDKDYALAWSYGVGESFTLLIPDFMGGESSKDLGTKSNLYKELQKMGAGGQARQFVANAPAYWGAQPSTSGPVYNGAIICFLFLLACFVVKGSMKWWLIAATILSLMLAWGRNFPPVTDFFFDHVPGYNKFRAVAMMLVIASFTMPLLALIGLQKFLDNDLKPAQKKKYLSWSFYIVGGLCAVFILLPTVFFDFSAEIDERLRENRWPVDALKDDRISMMRMDALRSLFFIGCMFAALWFYLKNKFKKEYLFIATIALMVIDFWMVDRRYLNTDDFSKASKKKEAFTPSQADLQIMQDKSLGYRVFNQTVSTFNDASTSYFHRSVGGYHGAKLKRFQELNEYQIARGNMKVLNMLNTKYFIANAQDGSGPVAQLNPDALGAAWIVREFKMVANSDSEIAALTDFDPRTTAIIDQRYEPQVKGMNIIPDPAATIKLVSYQPNHLVYESSTATDQLAVFSEIHYDKGWNATIDGTPADYFRCNYVLRGMKIPSGKHKIEFKFEPATYYKGEKIALAGSLILFAAFAGAVFYEWRKSRSKAGAVK